MNTTYFFSADGKCMCTTNGLYEEEAAEEYCRLAGASFYLTSDEEISLEHAALVNGQVARVVPEITEGEAAARARTERDHLLLSSDWTQVPDAPVENKTEWAAYRQELRDVTEQIGFPFSINWPAAP